VVEGAVLARVWEMPDEVRSEVDSPWSMGIADGAMADDVLCGLLYVRNVKYPISVTVQAELYIQKALSERAA